MLAFAIHYCGMVAVVVVVVVVVGWIIVSTTIDNCSEHIVFSRGLPQVLLLR